MQAPSTTRVFSWPSSFSVHRPPAPTEWYCHSSSPSSATAARTLRTSSLSVKCAPMVQQPSSGRSASMPWQPFPKMQVHDDVSQVRSQR